MLMASCVLFASRRRHTRCALVTGVQTCALPIAGWKFNDLIRVPSAACPSQRAVVRVWRKPVVVGEERDGQGQARSEERRVGTECVRTCRSRWSPNHSKTNLVHTDHYTRLDAQPPTNKTTKPNYITSISNF